jgi:hypothetical protein
VTPDRRARRHTAGLLAITPRNVREKWLWSAKPQLWAISASEWLVRSIISHACRTRCSSSHLCGDSPVVALKACAKWLRDSPQAAASVATGQAVEVASVSS